MDELLREAVARIAGPGQVVEVRALADLNTHSGYFNDYDALVRQVEALGTDTTIQGIYITLNEVNPALFSRRANRIKMRLGKKESSTSDADILHRRWLPIDIDPLRPSGVSSTDEEHGLALAKAEEIARWIAGLGFPEPIRADSGNGAHLLYRIDLPNDDAATALVKACLTTLDTLFSDERVSVDTANFNAARIWKLYGTVSRKGDSTPERPHRRSCIISAPDVPGVVTREQLETIVARLPTEAQATQPPKAKDKGIDLRRWLSDHGVAVRSEKPYNGGTLYALDQCPFSSAHKDGAFAIQFGSGAIFAGCKHASCGGGTQRWQELREQFEPGRVDRRKQWEQTQTAQRKDRAKMKAEHEGGTGPALPEDPYLRAEAAEVLAHGDPLTLMLTAFAQEHIGDEILARCMLLSMASQAVKNSDGLHVSVTGESGKGKTHAFKKMMRQVPDRYKVRGTMSNKALYYMTDLSPRTVLMSDDTELSDAIQEILKSATSNFHEPITHTTVTKDLTPRVCTIPERCVWWIAKKEGTGDDQVMNRMLTCWIDESPEQDAKVLAAKQKKEQQDPETTNESPELATCRAIWQIMHEQMMWVIIPFSERIRFHAINNRRNPDMLYDLIKSHTALNYLQRTTKTMEDGTLCVYADEADFTAANDVFTLLNGTAGGQESKMTKKESDLLGAIQQARQDEFAIQDLQRLTGWSYISIYRALKGYESRGKNYTGLLEKCPALSFTDRTVTISEEQGNSIRRRSDAFQWDTALFREWNCGDACWLDRDPKDGGGPALSLQQASSSVAEPAENKNNNFSVSVSPGTTKNNCTNVLRDSAFQQKENYGVTQQPGPDVIQCVHKSGNAANNDRIPPGAQQSPDSAPERVPISSSTCCKPLKDGDPPAASAAKRNLTIRARDYKPLELPEPKSVCSVCGKKGSSYVEKFTAERKARPRDQQDARRICKACYKAAVKAEQEASVPLPGTVDVSRCERVTEAIGKCSVCGLVKAEWIDREVGVKLCEHCYGRGMREKTRGSCE
ncbi:MAG: hypothetical protein Q7J03_00125 [Methanoregula sp.]|nr:hypothetical protein [Methanoregula sp.]